MDKCLKLIMNIMMLPLNVVIILIVICFAIYDGRFNEEV